MMWFTADLHFGHSSILSKMNRPFETIERMNQGLLAAINERVAPSDSLYVLGDFAYQTIAEKRTPPTRANHLRARASHSRQP